MDLNQFAAAVIDRVKGYVGDAHASLAKRIDELEARLAGIRAGPRGEVGALGERGPQGERGAPGADADPARVNELVERQFSAMAEAFIQGANDDVTA